MKITKQQLKRIIQEEIRNVLLEGDLIKGPWGGPADDPWLPDDMADDAPSDDFLDRIRDALAGAPEPEEPSPEEEEEDVAEIEDPEALIEYIIELILPGGALSPALLQLISQFFPGAEQWREQWARKLTVMIGDLLRENKELLSDIVDLLGEGITEIEDIFLLILENLFG